MSIPYKILVCIKQVPDANAKIYLEKTKPYYDEKTVYVINRYDEYALEEALQLKDKGLTHYIHTISAGPDRIQKALRRSLEMGADEAYHIVTINDDCATPYYIAQCITDFAKNEYDIIFTGVMSQDAMNQQTGQLIASMLGYNYATGVTGIQTNNDVITVTRELDAQTSMQYALKIPCVIAVQSSSIIPRYPSLSNVLRAKKQHIGMIKPIKSSQVQYHSFYTIPQKTTECEFIEGITDQKVVELYKILHRNAVV